ncbi:hypothetical protein T8A63_15380 [Sulfitobacter sp. OXR-159]|uniref:hypothetical protein n=1 Tax=Sulfitobacter sp. OXR-159 TaxID=3100174 RepID=UPI002AC9C2AA|nr:hypothetical protein [Sulfitobacter sp. OXR-159]WPZ28995.1 hypothetical protein T8A63_15380 [Sulfitobacter sp. OXR-159]
MPSKETPSKSNKFALVTLHPWLPSEATQIAQARTWGIPEDLLGEADVSPVFVEDVRKAKRTTNWPGKLPLRADFFKRMAALKLNGGQVFFSTPLAVGFSEKHARHTLDQCFGIGMSVYIHTLKDNGPALFMPGDDMAEFIASVGALANAAAVRATRARKS